MFESAISAERLKRTQAAIELYERCLVLGDAPARYGATVGCGTDLPRIALAELELARGDLDAARDRLEWCAAHRPGYLGLVGPYATVRLRAGEVPDEVVAVVRDRLGVRTAAARLALAGALHRAGALPTAVTQYRCVLVQDPGNSAAQVALADTLLSLGRFAEAADAAAIDEQDPYALSACRVALTAQIAAGRLDAARVLEPQARRLGMSAAERELFAAWIALASGHPPQRPLTAAAMPLLATVLELMLGAGDRTAFDLLGGALRESALPAREQRELLAGVHLRRGELAQAGAEWMAVCEAEPDLRALVGLARVAAAGGMADDAVVFARAATELDPADPDALAILRRLQAEPAAVG